MNGVSEFSMIRIEILVCFAGEDIPFPILPGMTPADVLESLGLHQECSYRLVSVVEKVGKACVIVLCWATCQALST